jgi:glycosyltransferase involved in cell wall biosynthesis
VHVLCFIDSLVRSGAEQALLATAPPLLSRGVALEVAYLRERPGLHQEFAQAGVPVVHLDTRGGPAGWLWQASRLVRARRPDLVHTTLFKGSVVGRLAGAVTTTPVVSSLVNVPYGHERRTPETSRLRLAARQIVDTASAHRVVRFHAVSEWVADAMASMLRVPRTLIDVVPRGRDPEILGRRTGERRAEAQRRLGVSDGTKLLVAVGRQDRQKGFDVLLEAFALVLAHHPDTLLLIAGRAGNQTAILKASLVRLGLERTAHFLGVRDDVADLLCAADVVAVPSRWEGFSGIVMEAMALEAPLVASDLPPVREALGGEAQGRLVTPDRPDALAAAIVAIFDDPSDASTRAARARSRFLSHFTVERVADQMAAFYARAIRAGVAPG